MVPMSTKVTSKTLQLRTIEGQSRTLTILLPIFFTDQPSLINRMSCIHLPFFCYKLPSQGAEMRLP